MLMAVLYDSTDAIAAVAPACDVVPYGDRYWVEIHERLLGSWTPDFHTAFIEVDDRQLAGRLLAMDFDSGPEAAEVLDKWLFNVADSLRESV